MSRGQLIPLLTVANALPNLALVGGLHEWQRATTTT